LTTPPSAVTDDDRLIAMWLHGRPARTRKHYASIAADLRATVAAPIQAIGLAHIQEYAASLERLAPRTQANRLSAVKSLFTFALKIGYIPLNPTVAVQMPRIKNTLAERILSEADVLRMIEAEPNERNRTILWLLYATGIRRAELCGLRGRDIANRGSAGQITVFGKGGKTRAIMVEGQTWTDLSRYTPADPHAPVFMSQMNKPISPGQVWRIVKAAAKRVGLPEHIGVHAIRHSHASHALENGASLALVRDTLGHASIATTSAYIHSRPNESSSRFIKR